jgi:hypothetical protein
MGTQMNQDFNTKRMLKANQPEVGFKQVGSSSKGSIKLNTPTKKHISYNKYDDRVLKGEEKLMERFNCGYSSLHKMLILKELSNQFSTPYL